ncbi:MAG: cytochrome b/b6 domain-containing protein [Methylophilaceae bacterium]
MATQLDTDKPELIHSNAKKFEWIKRHSSMVRVMHWINVVCFFILLMSGLNIFNSNAVLYWGKSSYNGTQPILQIKAQKTEQGGMLGVTTLFGHSFNTTGVLGLSQVNGKWTARAFPSWATIPDRKWLSMSRLWHFFFAWVFVINGLMYITYAIYSRHLTRDLTPTPKDWRSIGQSIKDHLRFKHPTGEAAKHYNVLQKLTYLIVIFVLLPMVILMGLAMSPMVNTVITGWVDWFGGRQSARTLHFVVGFALVAFVLIHVFEVIITGLWNNLRSMITGRYKIETHSHHDTKGDHP